jgi:hypothetical protein
LLREQDLIPEDRDKIRVRTNQVTIDEEEALAKT